jgi:hypothetical protein
MPTKGKQRRKRNIKEEEVRNLGTLRSSRLFNANELQELSALISPFAEESRGARILDAYSGMTAPVTVTWNFVSTADSSGLKTIQFHPYYGANQVPQIDETDGASPSARTARLCQQDTAFSALLGGRRLVGFGMRCLNTYPPLSTQGKVRAGLSRLNLHYGASSYRTWSAAIDDMKTNWGDFTMSAPDDGAHVRWQPDELEDISFRMYAGGTAYGRNGIESFPTFSFSGLANGQTVQLTAIAHYEVIAASCDIIASSVSPIGMRHKELLMVSSRAPIAASAHSFIKFARIAFQSAKILSQLLSAGLPIVASFL